MVQIHPSLPSTVLVVVVLGLQAVQRRLKLSIGGLLTVDDGLPLGGQSIGFGLACFGKLRKTVRPRIQRFNHFWECNGW